MTPTTPRQARALSALAARTGKAMPAELWEDGDAAEKRLSHTKSWRRYRKLYPR